MTITPGYDQCQCCGREVEPPYDITYGGDGYGDRCCGEADAPAVIECEYCHAQYQDGDLVEVGTVMPARLYVSRRGLSSRSKWHTTKWYSDDAEYVKK